jgi:hypothetical protein
VSSPGPSGERERDRERKGKKKKKKKKKNLKSFFRRKSAEISTNLGRRCFPKRWVSSFHFFFSLDKSVLERLDSGKRQWLRNIFLSPEKFMFIDVCLAPNHSAV